MPVRWRWPGTYSLVFSRDECNRTACACGRLCNRAREMSTLDDLFNRGRKRRLESLEGTAESQVSTDGSASSLIDADSECSQSDDAIAPRPRGKTEMAGIVDETVSLAEEEGNRAKG